MIWVLPATTFPVSRFTPHASLQINIANSGGKHPGGCTGRDSQPDMNTSNVELNAKGKAVAAGAKANGLSDRQRPCVTAYLSKGFNATRAAMAAGHKCNSYSAFGLQGGEAFRNPKGRAAIDAYFRQADMSAD